MMLRNKIIILAASLAASKHAIGSALATSVVAAAVAPSMGFDPVTWAMAGAGAAGAHFKIEEKSRRSAIGNGIISVFLGGLGGPYLPSLVLSLEYPGPSAYLSAFILAVAWPFMWNFLSEKWGPKK